MDGYLQTALVASGPPLSPPSQQNRTSHLTKLLKPCPPSNKEFNCDNFHAVEGTYSLVNEIHFDTIAPQFSSGTRISILDVRPKQRLAKSTSSATTNSSTATNDTPLYHHEDDKSTSSTATIASSSLASPPPPPPLSLEAARTISTPLIVQQAAPQLSPSLLSSTTTLGNSPLTATLDSMGITRSTALPIPNVTARSYDSNHSSSTSFQPGTTTTNGTLTPPHSRATPNSSIPTALPSPANATLTATPTPTSSTPFALHHHPHHHLDSASAAPEGISDLSTSVSSLSALFSRRNSVRYMHSPQRKPKNNLVKTKSSFVLRMIVHDRLAQVLANRTIDDSFLFFNIGTSFLWMDAKGKPKDPLSRIVFTKAYPTCHDINLVTKSSEHLDVIIGFSSGDCVWYDPLTSKYFRLNKDGNMKRGSVTNVKWIPGSEDLFMASFADGTILILDKDREDQAYTTPTVGSEQFHASRPHKSAKYNPVSHWSALGKGIVAFEFSPDGIHLAILAAFESLHLTMPTLHPAPNKTQVPLLQPSTIRTQHADPCVDLVFRQHGILTADRRGRIRTWGRP
ncbi:hypothetical protein [Absidia glauca]|uniref:Uncharacterized protein n=1 Tax=Absidia glauca TaxID=4829 RepID=A0A168N410_ABSGL|nr:hypothetical protein [Absidia glauca]